ncbi:unnamed protein product [Echinostoma caproni]|uniref:Letm1 RBD domain-containing protein n=1 Tax=Echinostoma caproni TaxID=27848 RepID=A0A183B8V9_9TREM|nr:unnamed protein product [Echinostoma caproni]
MYCFLFIEKSGQFVSDEEITRFSKLFEDQITLDSLEVNQLKMLCRLLSLPTIGPSNLLRFQLQMRVRQLKAEDRLLAKEGVDSIPTWELQTLCQDRGMRSVGLTEERLRNQLAQWLNLHLVKNVPVTLLLFSRALHVSKASAAELPLKEASLSSASQIFSASFSSIRQNSASNHIKSSSASKIIPLLSLLVW